MVTANVLTTDNYRILRSRSLSRHQMLMQRANFAVNFRESCVTLCSFGEARRRRDDPD